MNTSLKLFSGVSPYTETALPSSHGFICKLVSVFSIAIFPVRENLPQTPFLFSLCTVVYVPIQGAWHDCWCVIPSDMIVLSIYNISNAWITHDYKCDFRCLCLKWDICFHFMSLLYTFLSHLQLNIFNTIKGHDSGQSITVILYSAMNRMPNVYMLYGMFSLTSIWAPENIKNVIRLRKYLYNG